MKCSHIIDGMTWSYSRITAYEDCKYKFYLKYIKKQKGVRNFFSDFGSFIHLILQKFYCKELKKEELVSYYLMHFQSEVVGRAPSFKIFQNYFNQGLEYIKNVQYPKEEILGVEKEIHFSLQGKDFVGYIDLLSQSNGDLIITDNKSKALKPRSLRLKPTKTDLELDDYLRQLYIYSIPIKEEFEKYPSKLRFNCFRTQTEIIEPFDEEALEKAKVWALKTIEEITENESWEPSIDPFKCEFICDLHENCEYFTLFRS